METNTRLWDDSRTRLTFSAGLLLASQPWDWIGPLVRAVRDWLYSDAIRELPANAGLFLITGGLSILTLIVSLVFLQNVLPLRATEPLLQKNVRAERELRPIDPRFPGRILRPVGAADKKLSFHEIDSLFETLLRVGLGEPRILAHTAQKTHIRLYLCPACVSRPANPAPYCQRERRALETAFANFYRRPVKAVETRCKRRGDPECEVEVTH